MKLHRFLFAYREAIAKIFNPFTEPSGLLVIAEADNHNRFRAVAGSLLGRNILDVGAGGKSFFSLKWPDCLSVDLRNVFGVDVVASATSLPFKDACFETVVCVDTLEHVPKPMRNKVISEIRRVASHRVVVHTPVQDGFMFLGRSADILFDAWYMKANRRRNETTSEHIVNVEPSRKELEDAGFVLKGTLNVGHWLTCMRLASHKWPVGAIASQAYFLVRRSQRFRPPFWGAIGVLEKKPDESAQARLELLS